MEEFFFKITMELLNGRNFFPNYYELFEWKKFFSTLLWNFWMEEIFFQFTMELLNGRNFFEITMDFLNGRNFFSKLLWTFWMEKILFTMGLLNGPNFGGSGLPFLGRGKVLNYRKLYGGKVQIRTTFQSSKVLVFRKFFLSFKRSIVNQILNLINKGLETKEFSVKFWLLLLLAGFPWNLAVVGIGQTDSDFLTLANRVKVFMENSKDFSKIPRSTKVSPIDFSHSKGNFKISLTIGDYNRQNFFWLGKKFLSKNSVYYRLLLYI